MGLHVVALSSLLLTTLISLVGLWRYRRVPAGRWHLALFGVGVIYVAALLGEFLSPAAATKAMWQSWQLSALTWAPAIMVCGALRMMHTPLRRLVWLLVVPSLSPLLAFTNPWHHLVWTAWRYEAGVAPLRGVYGPGFWVVSFYQFATFMAALFYHFHMLAFLPRPQRWQVMGFLAGVAIILLGAFMFIERLSMDGGLFVAYVGGLVVNLSASGWLWLKRDVPYFVAMPLVPREPLVESLPYSVLVLSAQGHVLDVNGHMANLVAADRDALLGRHYCQALAGWPELVAFCRRVLEGPASVVDQIAREGRRYEARSVPVCLSTAQHLGYTIALLDVTEREALREEAAFRARHFEALYRLSERLAPVTDVETLAETAVEVIQDILEYAYAGLFLVDERTGERVLVASRGWGEKGWRLRPGEGVSEQALVTGKLHYTPDVTQDPRYVPGLGTGSEVDVPIFVEGKPAGVLVVEAREPHAFEPSVLATLSAVGQLLGQTLERVRLFEQMRGHEARLQIVQEILARLNADPKVESSFRVVAAQLQALTRADRVSIAMRSPDGKHFVIRALAPEGDALSEGMILPLTSTRAAVDVLAGRVHVTPDLGTEADTPAEQALLAAGYRSRVNIPLRLEGRVLGALNLAWREPKGWDERLLPLVQQVADAIGMAYERSRLLEQATRQAQELGVAYEVGLALVESRSLSDLLQRLVEQLERFCAPDAVGVFRYIPERETLAVILAVEDGEPLSWLVGQEFSLDESALTGWVARARRSVRFGDITREETPVSPRQLTDPPARAWMGVPLLLGERLVGVLTVQSARADAFTEDQQRLLETLAPSIALALENARLLEAEQAARQRWERLFEAAQALSTTLDLQEVFHRILSELRKVVPYDSASVQELRGDRLVIIGGHGFPNPDEILGMAFRVDDPTSPNGRVVRTRQPLILEDAPSEYAQFLEDPHAAAHIRSWMGVPMLYGDKVVGMITLDKQEPHFYTEEHARVVTAFAAQAAIAVQNARLFAQVQAAAERHAVLHQTGRDIMLAGPDVERICEALYRGVRQLLPHSTFAVTLVDWEKEEGEGVYLIEDGKRYPPVRFPLGKGLTSWVAYRGESLRLVNAQAEIKALNLSPVHFGRRRHNQSILMVPMRVGERIVGSVTVQSPEPNAYSEQDLEVLELLAATAAGALETARLFQRLRDQAERLQRILDTMPEGVLLLDATRRVVLANPQAQRWMDLLAVSREGPVEKIGEHDVVALAKQPEWQTVRIARKVADAHWFQVVVQAIGDEAAPTGWLVLLRDVTREREIERRVQEHERLAALGRLAAGIAHDFNNILQGIVGFTQQFASREDVPPDVRHRMVQVVQYGQRGMRLVRRMLDFARATTPQLQECDLREVVEETMNWLTATLPRAIRVHLRLSEEPCPVMADREQLEEVLVNLVLNARDAMPDGGDLTVAVERLHIPGPEAAAVADLAPGVWVALRVEDTGVGISEDILPHIFEPFFTTKEVGKGVGLGLAQVYGIVQQHRGTIAVDSRPGEGTTFTVFLPEARTRAAGPATESPFVVVWTDNPTVATEIQGWVARLGGQSAVVTAFAELAQQRREFDESRTALVVDLTSPRVAEEFREWAERLRAAFARRVVAIVPDKTFEEGEAWYLHLPWPTAFETFARTVEKAQQALGREASP